MQVRDISSHQPQMGLRSTLLPPRPAGPDQPVSPFLRALGVLRTLCVFRPSGGQEEMELWQALLRRTTSLHALTLRDACTLHVMKMLRVAE